MILHIYPIADSNSVLLIDDDGHFSKSRDLVFGALDLRVGLFFVRLGDPLNGDP